MAGSAKLAERVDNRTRVGKVHNLRDIPGRQRVGGCGREQRIAQHDHLRLGQMKIGHKEGGLQQGIPQGLGGKPGNLQVQFLGQTVAAPANHVTAPASQFIEETVAGRHSRAVRQPELGVSAREKITMGDRLAVGTGIAAVAGDAAPEFGVMVRVTAEASRFRGGSATTKEQQNAGQKEKTNDQFGPRKKVAITVSRTITRKTATVMPFNSRWSRGHQAAVFDARVPGSQGRKA